MDSENRPSPQPSLAKAALRQLPAIIATGAVILYALGVVSTMGAVKASHLDLSQAFGRIPVETHLRNGVAELGDPLLWFFVVAYTAIYFVVRLDPIARVVRDSDGDTHCETGTHQGVPDSGESQSDQAHGESAPPTPFRLKALMQGRLVPPLLYLTVLALLLSSVIVSAPWPEAIGILASVSVIPLPVLLPTLMPDQSGEKVARAYVFVAACVSLVVGGAQTFYRSDPLPTGVVTTAARTVSAPIIGSDGGLLYLGPASGKQSKRGEPIYQAVPTNRILRLSAVQEKREKDEPSVLNFIGIDWR